MASSAGAVKGGQDMVVSIRYRNDLPPPPMPPKLLNIDNGGLAQYLTTSFAAAIARREEPNIEADAEGGMPIDMIGIPGYFLGDESAIMAPEIQPVLDPADHALMLTPEQLRNQNSKSTNVSFLRRTQYMSSHNARANDPLVKSNPRGVKSTINSAAQKESLARDDKENIRRHLQKGFDLAYPESIPYNGPNVQSQAPTAAEKEAWRNPIHPENPGLKPVSFFPILPDFDTVDDANGLQYVKFDKPPLPAVQGRRDDRIDVAMLKALDIQSQKASYLAKRAAFEKNPERYEDPGQQAPISWSLSIPHAQNKVAEVRKILDEVDVSHDDQDLFDGLQASSDTGLGIDYDRVRTYISFDEKEIPDQPLFGLSLYDPTNATGVTSQRSMMKERAAYYYRIPSTLRLKSDRVKVGHGNQTDENDQNPFDVLSVHTREPNAVEKARRLAMRGDNDSSFRQAYVEMTEAIAGDTAAEEAQEAREEQGTVPREEQDVTMEEVEHTGEMDVATNGLSQKDADRNDTVVSDGANGMLDD